jgi:hypothetical protein
MSLSMELAEPLRRFVGKGGDIDEKENKRLNN